MVMMYFASGSSRVPDFNGIAIAGWHPGVTLGDAKQPEEYKILENTHVFVDTGAFSEVNKDLELTNPISPKEWSHRMDEHSVWAARLGRKAYLVAPDRVGDQDYSFQRLTENVGYMRHWLKLDANVLVPLPKGRLPIRQYWDNTLDLVGTTFTLGPSPNLIPALPMKKNAISVEECIAFLNQVRPPRIHLLGVGIRSHKLPPILKAISEYTPYTQLSCDSCLIRSMSGKSRRLELLDRKRNEEDILAMSSFHSSELYRGLSFDITDNMYFVSQWSSRRRLRAIANDLESCSMLQGLFDRSLFINFPETWLEKNSNDWVYQILLKHWVIHCEYQTRSMRRQWSIVEALRQYYQELPAILKRMVYPICPYLSALQSLLRYEQERLSLPHR